MPKPPSALSFTHPIVCLDRIALYSAVYVSLLSCMILSCMYLKFSSFSPGNAVADFRSLQAKGRMSSIEVSLCVSKSQKPMEEKV